ncbi:MAG: sigma-70 family RNA polymerase sigma factor [Verrucomicrobiota bacterium]
MTEKNTVPDFDDASLICRFRQDGDTLAIRTLFERYESQLKGYLMRILSSPHDAEDALQEAFCKALKSLSGYRESNRFKSWLFRIAHNEAMNIIRRRGRTELREEPPEPNDSMDDASTTLMQREDHQALETAIRDLPETERRVVLLRMKSGLTFKEIAELECCSINTVLGRMHNAKKRLRVALVEEAA